MSIFSAPGDGMTSGAGKTRLDKDIVVEITFYDNKPEGYQWTVLTGAAQKISLPNARVGERYCFEVDLLNERQEGTRNQGSCKIVGKTGLSELGLDARIEGNGRLIIFGTPKQTFDGNICFKWATVNKDGGKPTETFDTSRTFSVIASDPFSLWEKHDPSEGLPYAKPLDVCEGVKLDLKSPITILAARKRGRSHEHVGSFCDDHYAMRLANKTPEEYKGVVSEKDSRKWHVFAVADGAGSAKYSRKGSQLACDTVVNYLSDVLEGSKDLDERIVKKLMTEWDGKSESDGGFRVGDPELIECDARELGVDKYVHNAVYKAYMAILNEAQKRNAEVRDNTAVRDYHTTLMFLAAKRIVKPKMLHPMWALISYWIGDGGLAIYRPSGKKDSVLTLGSPDGGEYAGETRFLTMKEEIAEEPILRRTRVTLVRYFESIVMTTDGVTDPYFPTDSRLKDSNCWNKFWGEILPEIAPGALDKNLSPEDRAKSLLKGMEFKVKGCHDDRTMLTLINDNYDGLVEKIQNSKQK